jgi:2-polyprenyl-3-methyl-5-hydroxy-6-metoxy-1,4-benzoquinol methylase
MRIAHYSRQALSVASRRTETTYRRQLPTLRRWRARTVASAETLATRFGARGADLSRALLLAPHRAERISEPPPLRIGSREFDVVDDLSMYTELPRERVVELLQRHHESFRSEWQSFPELIRSDHWYYLSSRTYIFANAIHLHGEDALLARLLDLVPSGATALDFGGGTGNLVLALAATGRQVAYAELSALQRDFVRFRVARHDLTNFVHAFDWWDTFPRASFDVLFALDVLEHLPELEATLRDRLLPAVRPGGALVEASPFVQSLSNPMHHEDAATLDDTLSALGFALVGDDEQLRVWRAPNGNERK